MENQTKRDVERGLLLQLRESVNEQEELDWIEAELACLDAEEPTCGNNEQGIYSVAEAVQVLQQCGFVVVQVQIVPAEWVVKCRADVFSGTYTGSEVIQLARGEHALHLLRSQEDANSPTTSPGEPPAAAAIPINTVAEAVGFLAERCDLLAVQVEDDPTIWRVVSLDGEFEALFTELDLVDFARGERHRHAKPKGELEAEVAAEPVGVVTQSDGGAL